MLMEHLLCDDVGGKRDVCEMENLTKIFNSQNKCSYIRTIFKFKFIKSDRYFLFYKFIVLKTDKND